MAEEAIELKLIANDSAVSVAIGAREYLVLGVSEDGKIVIHLVDDDLIDLASSTEELPFTSLDVKYHKIARRAPLRPQSQDHQVLPAAQAVDESPKDIPQTSRLTPLQEHFRDVVIEAVMDSWAQDPAQNQQETALESHRIAEDVFGSKDEHSVHQIAGVRAALTRGSYDNSHAGAAQLRQHIWRHRYGKVPE